jgi:hypothetical protein
VSDKADRMVRLFRLGVLWLVPAFDLPWLSRAAGTRIYDWIASHRHVISDCGVAGAVACAVRGEHARIGDSPQRRP